MIRLGWIVVAVAGCSTDSGTDDDGVGIPCEMSASSALGSDDPIRINTEAPDCRSNLCIKYNRAAAPRCSAFCDMAEDCPESSETCAAGFACVVTMTVDCCKMCVCRDQLSDPNEDPLASACRPERAATCQSVFSGDAEEHR